MTNHRVRAALAATAVLWPAATCRPQEPAAPASITAETLTDEHVRLAIDAIAGALLERKDPARFWEPEATPTGESPQAGGYTALVVLALLHSGRSYQLPELRDAVAYLEDLQMDGTYAVAVRAGVWAMLPPTFHELLEADARWLGDGFSDRAGGWTYRQAPTTTRRDNSITQYGALAWWEAAKRDVPVDRRRWQLMEERFVDMQLADGGWNYTGDGPATGSMTTAGLATLYIAQDLLHAAEDAAIGDRPSQSDQALERGLAWMQDNFSPTENPGRDEYFFYYLYGVERVGLAGGHRYFGRHDWFRAGAAEIIGRLCRWDPAARTMAVHERVRGDRRGSQIRVNHLAFALLFLSRGRVPVAVNKLQMPEPAPWNNRPRDVANLTAWLAETTETALNWQIVSLAGDPLEWLDAPLLYVASNEPFPDSGSGDDPGPVLRGLETYLNRGGMLVAICEGNSPALGRSIEQALGTLYPDHQWRLLPDDHWVYTLHWPVTGRRPPLRGISNGVRELAIVAPGDDWSRAFQLRDTDRPELWRTAAHLYLHASEMNRPRPRLGGGEPAAPPGVAASADRPLVLARGVHDGNWLAEPEAMPRFAAWHGQATGQRIALSNVLLDQVHRPDPAPDAVIVSGIEPRAFTAGEREAIRAYVEAGGVILFETPGGRGGFTASAEAAMREAFPGQPIYSLRRSPVVTGDGIDGAADLSRIGYRPYSIEAFNSRPTMPRLRGLDVHGQPRVLFSREDMSHAMLDQPCWSIAGYTTAGARQLLRNVLLHGRRQREESGIGAP